MFSSKLSTRLQTVTVVGMPRSRNLLITTKHFKTEQGMERFTQELRIRSRGLNRAVVQSEDTN